MEYLTSNLVFFWYRLEPLGECVYQENKGDVTDNSRLFLEKGLHNYFIPCHRKVADMKVGCDAVELH